MQEYETSLENVAIKRKEKIYKCFGAID